MRAQIALLTAARRDVARALAGAIRFRRWQLGQVLAGIDAELARYASIAQEQATKDAASALGLGIELLGASPSGSLYSVSPELLQAVIDVVTDQTRSVWGELGTQLKANVRRAALGVTDQFTAISTLAQVIRNPKTFGTARTRAEFIMRGEVGRAFEIATFHGMEQAVRAGVKMGKWWLAANDGRTRPSHAAASRRYDESHAIPISKPFIVGGFKLMYPLDPLAPVGETAGCRCRSVPRVLE